MSDKIFWDKNTGIVTYTIHYKGKAITATAKCHETDKDYGNEYTGTIIAETRALIKLYEYQRKIELIPTKIALNHLLSTMESSKKFNPNSYEAKRIKKEIKIANRNIEDNKQLIKELKEKLNTFINDKDKFYKILRNHNKEVK